MSGIKNRDGSINWSNVKINSVKNNTPHINTTPVTLDLTPAYISLAKKIKESLFWGCDEGELAEDHDSKIYFEGYKDALYELLDFIDEL